MSSSKSKAFTLVELLISLALMVVLMLGVNYIFGSVGAATGNAQALSRITREAQAMQNMIYTDLFSGVAPDAPFLAISSQVRVSHRTLQEELAGEPQEPRRQDITSFFIRGNFPRQTGNDGYLVADQSAVEAWVWYGHVDMPGSAGRMRPGQGDKTVNPVNYFASQWALGRVAMLLIDPIGPLGSGTISANGVNQRFIERKTATGLAPLAVSSVGDTEPGVRLEDSRYDLAGTSFRAFSEILKAYIPSNPIWTGRMMLDDTANVAAHRRFLADPYFRGSIDSAKFASKAPLFAEHCSEFVVEFAGDFVTQDVAGVITAYGADGQTDFIVAQTTPPMRRVRWYGFPRDVAGPTGLGPDGVILGAGNTNLMVDVVPLKDVLTAAGHMPTLTPPEVFPERSLITAATDYGAPGAIPTDYASCYSVVWGPDTSSQPTPSMLRFTVTLDDGNGRINNPPTFEYVLKLR